MAAEVLSGVLALSVWKVPRLVQDPCPTLARTLVVRADVGNAHKQRLWSRQRLRRARLGNHDRPAIEPQLRSVVSSLPAGLETELVAKPPDRLTNVLVDQNGDHRRRRHRPVEAIAVLPAHCLGHKPNLYSAVNV